MEITLEKIELVKDRTGVSYKEAKEALLETDGNVVDAIILLERDSESPFTTKFKEFVDDGERTADSIIKKIKEAIREGNVTKIALRDSSGKTITSVSVNAGAAIGVFATVVGAAPLVVISGLIAKFGLNYDFVIIKSDGSETVL